MTMRMMYCRTPLSRHTRDWKSSGKMRLFFTWLYRIATNESLTFLKKQKSRHFLPFGDYQLQLERTLESEPYFDGNELQLKLQKAIIRLPEKQRLVFNMKYFDEMKYDDMSAILGTSVGALKASYHHALKKIEQYLSED